MNRFLKTSATALIVAAGLSTGHASAEIQPEYTKILQEACEARFVRSKKPIRKFHYPDTSTVVHEDKRLSTADWPEGAVDLLEAVNDYRFDEGLLSVVDCVGSRSTVRVRTRNFELDHVNRQGNERRGWRFNAEAENLDQPIIRVVRLELPPAYAWKINSTGDGLIAEQTIFHPLSDDDFAWFTRLRVTEVSRVEDKLLVTQTTRTDNKFDVLETWTLHE